MHLDADAAVTVQAGWVNDLRLRVGDSPWASLGRHAYFRNREHRLALRAGWNRLQVKLDNPDDGMAGQAWGSWVFALRVIDDQAAARSRYARSPPASSEGRFANRPYEACRQIPR